MPSAANGAAPLQVTRGRRRRASPCPTWIARSPSTRACCRSSKVSDRELSGRPYELLSGVFGARSRVVTLRLGSEEIELTEFLAPKGRPMPADLRANDRLFQHIAIVVSDIAKAYDSLRMHQRRARVDRTAAASRLEPECRRHQRVLLPRSRPPLSRDHLRSRPTRDQPKWHEATDGRVPRDRSHRHRRRRHQRIAALLSRHARHAGRRRERELRRRAGTPEQRVRREAADHGASGGTRVPVSSCSNISRRATAGRRRPICARTTSRTGRRRWSRSDSIRCWGSPAIIESRWCRRVRWTPRRCRSAFALEPHARSGRPRDAFGRSVTRRRSFMPLMRLPW